MRWRVCGAWTRGDALTCGACDAFPLPGLRLRGDHDDLPLPLASPAAVASFVDHATRTEKQSPRQVHAWVLTSDQVEIGNPRWPAFVETLVARTRAPLGIAEACHVDATLSQVVLVRAGGVLPVVQSCATTTHHRSQVFGSLVVALPGVFTGGSVTVTPAVPKPPLQWAPRRRDNTAAAYDLTYAAFYNNLGDSLVVASVTSGVALYLVYDLVTPTIEDVPHWAGLAQLEQALEAALSGFFEAVPAAKRLKIGDDAWRTIHEFATDWRLVFPVSSDAFETLRTNDQRVAQRLETFCAKSHGQYVLYLAKLRIMRTANARTTSHDDNYYVYLHPPWKKQGETGTYRLDPIHVVNCVDLAPAGVLRSLLGNNNSNTHDAFALVVMPVTVEQAQWAQLPGDQLMSKLEDLVETAPAQAARLVQRVVARDRSWITGHPTLARLINIMITLNDARTFCDLFPRILFSSREDASVARAVRHVGWRSCVAAIERVMENSKLPQRVDLLCSVLGESTDVDCITYLVGVLTQLYPWTPRLRPADRIRGVMYSSNGEPSEAALGRLLAIACRSSEATVQELLAVRPCYISCFQLMVRSFVRFVRAQRDRPRKLRSIVDAFRLALETSLPEHRNASYAACVIPPHCSVCGELQSFLTSPATAITLTIDEPSVVEHIQTTVTRFVPDSVVVTVASTTTTTVRLTKQPLRSAVADAVEEAVALLATVLD